MYVNYWVVKFILTFHLQPKLDIRFLETAKKKSNNVISTLIEQAF